MTKQKRIAERRDETLLRMLKAPPKEHKDMVENSTKKAKDKIKASTRMVRKTGFVRAGDEGAFINGQLIQVNGGTQT